MPVCTANQYVSLHTWRGVQLYQFAPSQYTEVDWGRKLRDPSTCDLTVGASDTDLDRLPDIVGWYHWLSVWDGDTDQLMWTGPIYKAVGNRGGLTINAKDHSALLARTRNPITKRWDAADPAWIAGELWRYLIEAQGLNVAPIIRTDPEGDRYDFQVITDDKHLDQTVSDLVNLGLKWTVVSGAPIVGPLPLEAVATLGENDFQGDGIDFVRDASAVYNDVLVRGPDNLARAQVDYFGMNLQALVNMDNMFGVGNVQRAAKQYVRNTGSVTTKLQLPSGTVLRPDAPVSIEELMPSARFVIEAQGIRELMELTAVDVTRRQGTTEVKVSMEALPDRDSEGNLIELAELSAQKQPVVTLGGQANSR
ncbi:MAG: hypothetical protein JO214_00705 [Frankiaceae bacterium]|nr:hypothetical protein [Frankiaceae bacterium]